MNFVLRNRSRSLQCTSQTGTVTVALKPPSGLSDSAMSPPWERAMPRAIASPRPVPPSSWLRASSRRRNSLLRTFVNDDDPGHARTMAALDRELARGQRWSGFLDDLCAIPQHVCGTRARKRRRDADEDTIAA